MKNIEKKYLASLSDGGLDADNANFAVGPNRVVNAENVRWGTTDRGTTATVESVGGTVQISESLPSLTFVTIGSAEDVPNQRTLAFKCCTTGPWHKITCYDKQLGQELDVIFASQVSGGFNWEPNNLIYSSRVINGLLYWTEYNDRQNKINIDAAIKLNNPSYDTDQDPYVTPIELEVTTLIKRPPRYPLTVERVTQASVVTNFLGNNSFWFAYRYFFRDKETSVISVHSELIPYNAIGESYNSVDITVPFEEKIDQDVERVEIGVRVDNNPQFFGIKVWDKNVPADAQDIEDHNDGTGELYYRFFNNQVGEPWGDAYSVKYFESVPIKSKTLEIVRNRIHLGNNLAGYDTPLTTSLTATPYDQTDGAAVEGVWYEMVIDDGAGFTETYYVVLIQGIGENSGYYSLTPFPGIPGPPMPFSLDFTDYEYAGATMSDVFAYFADITIDPDAFVVSFGLEGSTSTVTNAPSDITLAGDYIYKSAAPYRLGVVFYDRWDRKCGVLTNDSLLLETSDRDYDTQAYTTSITWTLSNANALEEIPDWAYTYAVVRTKCLRTRNFLQARVRNISYATYDEANDVYLFTTAAYADTLKGVGIRIDALTSFGMGYLFEEANQDVIKVYIDGDNSVYSLRIIAQQGEWLVAQLDDLGALGTTASPKIDAFFEIYTPYFPFTNELFYEVGAKYLVNNAGREDRSYSVIADSIRGDVTILNRTENAASYLVEAMSANDRFYTNWFDDSGRASVVVRSGQVYKPNSIHYSNTFILGSNVNGLCEFEALNEKFVPYECGQIQKLQVTSKVLNQQGAVMLAICEMQTASIYIGEVQVVGSDANAFLAQSPDVIGSINILKGNFGTIDPQTVTEFRGSVWWLDTYNGKVIQYAGNGLFPISNYRMTRFWKLFCDLYNELTTAEIEALGSRPFVFTTVDPHHGELLITIPKLLDTPPKGYLIDYPSTIYPFDIYDGQAKTIVFKLDMAGSEPYWMGAYAFTPEWLTSLQNELYTWKNGIMWQHNQANYNEFYGVQYKSRVMVVANANPNIIKVYQAFSLEVNMIPTLTYFASDTPYTQCTDIMDYEYRNWEGLYYAIIKRNKILPNQAGYTDTNILTGERMRSYIMYCLLEFTVGNNLPLELRFVNFNYDLSRGGTTT